MLTAEIVAIGDELTSGQRLDTNSQWLSQQLADLGIRVLLHTTVADDLETGIQVIRQALQRVNLVICTGGEPLLQLDDALIGALHDAGFEVAVESNGTLPAPQGIDWLTVSPKSAADDPALVQRSGDELKLVFPQPGVEPEDFAALDFTHFYLQPMDGPDKQRNTALVLDYCRRHPRWRVSLQTHKILGVA